MKKKLLMVTGLALGMAVTASAGLLNVGGEINTLTDWSDGALPSPANPGFVTVNGTYTGHGSWVAGTTINQTAGTITSSVNSEFANLIYNFSGGVIEDPAGWRASTGSTFNMTGGVLNSKIFASKSTGIVNITGGTINIGAGGQLRVDNTSTMNLTGGSLDGNDAAIRFDQVDANTQLGGSFDLVDVNGFFGNGHLNIATDWTGSFELNRISNADYAAGAWETLFTSGKVLYNNTTLDAAGFAAAFSVDEATAGFGTLTVIPEPATLGLVAFSGLSILVIRRRLMM